MALQGKWALITGASRGVGERIAYAYAREGANLVLVAQSEDRLHQVAKACRPFGANKVEVHALSLANFEAVDKMAKSVVENHSCIDVLVNNAGILGPVHDDLPHMGQGPLEGNPDEWTDLMKVNVLAPMRLVRWLGPAMIQKGVDSGCAIINIASVAGTKGNPGNVAYSTSKNAMTGWSEAIHDELVSKGIKVICINPAAVATPMTFDRPDMDVIPERENQPEDIAQLALLPFKLSKWCNVKELTTANMIPVTK